MTKGLGEEDEGGGLSPRLVYLLRGLILYPIQNLSLFSSSSYLYIVYQMSQKNVGRLSDCEVALSNSIIVNKIFSRSQQSSLDHEAFPIKSVT